MTHTHYGPPRGQPHILYHFLCLRRVMLSICHSKRQRLSPKPESQDSSPGRDREQPRPWKRAPRRPLDPGSLQTGAATGQQLLRALVCPRSQYSAQPGKPNTGFSAQAQLPMMAAAVAAAATVDMSDTCRHGTSGHPNSLFFPC